jgi:hypothetical protein
MSRFIGREFEERPNQSQDRVKSADPNFGNDQICDMANFETSGGWIRWSKIEFSHRLSLEPTAIGAGSSAVAVRVTGSAAARVSMPGI